MCRSVPWWQPNLPESAAVLLEVAGFSCTAHALRGYGGAPHAHVLAAAEAVIAVLDPYKEVEVEECREGPSHWFRMPYSPFWGTFATRVRTTTILMRESEEPKKLEVTRATLAVLTEHYRDTPAKSDECDRAAAEADRLLKR